MLEERDCTEWEPVQESVPEGKLTMALATWEEIQKLTLSSTSPGFFRNTREPWKEVTRIR